MAQEATGAVPPGMHTLTTHLWFGGDCEQAVAFYAKAFGGELVCPMAMGPGGKGVMHAMLQLGDAQLMMADAWPGAWEQAPAGSATGGVHIYVEDCDALFERATKAGCEVVFPMMAMFWGDRMGKVKDPYGHCWGIATHTWDYTPEEIAKGQEEWLASMKG